MRNVIGKKAILLAASFSAAMTAFTASMAAQTSTLENTTITKPMVFEKIYGTAEKNANWKTALATGKQGQIVLMSVSPQTNPNNEVGMETHPFDQIILISDGHAKVILNGETHTANAGDLIFIPQGTAHNIINLDKDKPLKLISFYSLMDIPANSTYPTKADQPKD